MGLKHQTILDEVDGILSDAFDGGETADFQRGVMFTLKGLAGAVRHDSEELADRILNKIYRLNKQ